ncbi:hypothetical protein BHM03_00053120 [Ensete ventricosum]|nr:hypothetical protein BHM03_00053120 [Ensete ventricosum]
MARGIAWTPPHPAAPMDGISFVDCSFLFPFLSAAEYEAALNCLSSLITRRSRAVRANKGDRFDLMFDYLKKGVPACTVPQPDEAMRVLEEKASQLGVSYTVLCSYD